MEQLALFALPRTRENEALNADSNEAAGIPHSHSQSQNLSEMDWMSWRTSSSHKATYDIEIPDIAVPGLEIHGTEISDLKMTTAPAHSANSSLKILDIWSKSRLNDNIKNFDAFPYHEAAFGNVCSSEGHIFMQGGGDYMLSNTLRMWRIKTDEDFLCFPISCDNIGPELRLGHAVLLVGSSILVFGGQNWGKSALDNTLWIFETDEERWTSFTSTNQPAGRYGHTLNAVNSTIFIFGGESLNTQLNDLVALGIGALTGSRFGWNTLFPNESLVGRPSKRSNHTMVSWQESLYL